MAQEGENKMPLLKDKIRIMTVPPSPQRQLAAMLKDLRLQRAKLSMLFTFLVGRLPVEEAYLLQLRATAILREFDDLLCELDSIFHEIEEVKRRW
jgi:hypothetical protein